MTKRELDLLFALPRAISRAAVFGDLEPWKAALRGGGIGVVGDGSPLAEPPDLVVASRRRAHAAASIGAHSVLVHGAVPRFILTQRGYRVRYLRVLPSALLPNLVLPVDDDRALRIALDARGRPTRVRHARNALAHVALRYRLQPVVANVTLGVHDPGPPLLVATALATAGVELSEPVWWFEFGSGDELQRALLFIAPPDAERPALAVKFSRATGNSAPFDGDERGLHLVHHHAPFAARNAPRLLARTKLNGLEMSIETAAPGRPLNEVLGRATRDRGARLVEAIASWVLGLARESLVAPASLERERRRLSGEIVPAWPHQDLGRIVERLGPVAGVLQHNDLGTWNIMVAGESVTVLDWESARHPGFPLWDLLYFLTDALVRLDGDAAPDDHLPAAVRLLRGDHRRSAQLFTWVRLAVRQLGLHATDVGPIATLCWLHHGSSHIARRARLASATTHAPSGPIGHLERLAGPWLADPLLGLTWNRWQ